MADRDPHDSPHVNGHPPQDDDAAEESEVPPEQGGVPFDEALEQQEGPDY
ncbi:hypothetical protein BH09ACT3_BH09ACT3_00060 [soil metagenome]